MIQLRQGATDIEGNYSASFNVGPMQYSGYKWFLVTSQISEFTPAQKILHHWKLFQ